ncbi:MAG TPA: phage tail protein, partial [Dehalococcoidia bacterium]|nr:phage tail protein [Dehalococcoidia bacterium]
GRFLLIFESIWEPLEQRQDHMALYFDPSTCPAQFLYWLAAWLGLTIGPQTEEGRLRALLSEAVELHRWRGTRYGLTRLLEICTGVTPLISEVASNRALLHIRIALPPEAAVDRDAIERIVRANKPAHAGYLLEIIS